ncbi:hypothetical protein [Chamaesiphon sp. VAR_69_metabat_338]|uniref:hypothetical protein n=1 Tax=Chamaesiphon sp. VAR_69_metabat_338 TaxID=2964704 RepID=UPI00286D9EBB|nr:hypothetical protein [Chamaesiphon sp. VAR_69_metabat_338]
MDDANTSDRLPVTHGAIESTPQPDRDRFQTISEACLVMKDEIASTAQHLIGGKEYQSKPPTITEACLTIKGEIGDEARQILSTQPPQVKPQTFTAACDSIRAETVLTARQIVPTADMIQPAPPSAIEGAGDTEEQFDGEDTDDRRFYSHPIEQAQKAIHEAQWFEQ